MREVRVSPSGEAAHLGTKGIQVFEFGLEVKVYTHLPWHCLLFGADSMALMEDGISSVLLPFNPDSLGPVGSSTILHDPFPILREH